MVDDTGGIITAYNVLNSILIFGANGIQSSTAGIEATIYPNPSGGDAELQLYFRQPEKVVVQVRDMMGRMVWERVIDEQQKNTSLSLPSRELPAGIYLVNVAGSRDEKQLKWVKN